MVWDVKQAEEGCDEQQDVEHPRGDRDEKVRNLHDGPLGGRVAAIERNYVNHVAEANAQQGNKSGCPKEGGVFVDEDPG